MRVLFVTSLFPDASRPTFGLHNARLSRRLSNEYDLRLGVFRPRPWPLSVITPPGTWKCCPEDAANHPQFLQVTYVPKFGSLFNHLCISRSFSRYLAQLSETWSPDAIVAPWLYPDACGIIQAVSRGHSSIPILAVAQGTDVHQYLRMPIRRHVMRRYLNRCAGIICRSASLQNLLFHAGIRPPELTTIPNGVDLDLFHPQPAPSSPPLPFTIGDGQRLVLFVGNLAPVKNPGLLLAAAGLCREPHLAAAVEYVFAGNGPLLGRLGKQAAALGIAEHCHFLGNQPPGVIAALMRRADVLTVPSRDEGIPNVVREALASGTPVVATCVGGIPEILTDERVGVLTPENDREAFAAAIQKFLRQPPDRAYIRRYAERFSWKHTMDGYRDTFTRLINGVFPEQA